jgi:O-antigen/teichoic acid export membrane protein
MSDFSNNIFKNTYVKTIRNIALMGQGILLAPLVISVLGLKGAGVWFLITQFSAYVQLVDFGIPSGLTRQYSHYKSLKNYENSKSVVSISLLLLICISFILVLFSNEVSALFFSIFTTVESNASVKTAVSVAIILTAIGLPLRCGLGLLEANHLFYVHLWIETVFIFLRLIVIYVCYFFNWIDITVLAIVYFSATLLISFFQFMFSVKYEFISVFFHSFDLALLNIKKILSIGFSVLVVTASATTLRQGSPMILGSLEGVEYVAIFSIVMLLVTTLMQFITIPLSFIGPQASQLNATQEKDKLYELFVLYSKYSIMVSVIGVVAFYSVGEYLLKVWLAIDENNIHQIYLLTLILVASFALSVPALYARTILSFVDKHLVTSAAEVFVVLIGLLIGFINVRVFDLGMIGMAIGISLVFFFRGIGPIIFLFTGYFGIRKMKYFADIYSKNILTIFLLLAAIISLNILHNDNPVTVIEIFVLMIAALVLQWFLVIDLSHRQKIKSKVACYVATLI